MQLHLPPPSFSCFVICDVQTTYGHGKAIMGRLQLLLRIQPPPHHSPTNCSLQYNIVFGREHVLELESSTIEKFSRHLIIHLPNAAFETNIHLGRFVSQVLHHAEVIYWNSNPYVHNLHAWNAARLSLLYPYPPKPIMSQCVQ
jgi:hypothetical protein